MYIKMRGATIEKISVLTYQLLAGWFLRLLQTSRTSNAPKLTFHCLNPH